MIVVQNHLFSLNTNSTTYLFSINETGHLEHLYYGSRIAIQTSDLDALKDKHHVSIGTETAYNEKHSTLFLENLCQETSTEGKGDYRIPMVVLEYGKGMRTLDFVYASHSIIQGKPLDTVGNAQAYGDSEKCMTLQVELKDTCLDISLILSYTTFDQCDVLLRKTEIINRTKETVTIRNLSSLQLDLFDDKWNLTTFNGAWARERIKETKPLFCGLTINESRTGVSSSDHNPLLFLSRPNATEDFGEVIGCNLIYSGNHREAVEISPFGKTRLLCGINGELFCWKLISGASFTTPEAILTYSRKGFNKASENFHDFVNEHIIRGIWKYRERPVLLNNWEVTYFNFTEEKLLNLAKQARSLGFELFVLDDGWFGSRNDDTAGLGDWFVNLEKLPSGLAELSKDIHNMGMMFGLWVEPEMVNMRSLLYKKHPDWTIAIKGRESSVGRHQYILDLTREEVRAYLFDTLSEVFTSCDVNYVKWDMNRIFSDLFSANSEMADMGEFNHRYVLGLYGLLSKLTEEFPNVLFEGCASGGNRFDLGMLCYFKQIWTSDNTDTLCRTSIQEGTSYGYPLSSMGCHVSDCPNHQTLRNSDLESRFNVACFGDLGYEMDITTLTKEQKQTISEQIDFYKQMRPIFQFGTFSRNRNDSIIQWTVTSQDKNTLIVLWFQTLNPVNTSSDLLLVPQVEEDATYDVFPRQQKIPLSLFGNLIKQVGLLDKANDKIQKMIVSKVNLDSEIEHYTVSGGILKYAGIKLNQQFSGTGYDSQTRVLGDFGSRLYIIRKH